MKALAIILTFALVGVMGWLILDSRSEAKSARNQLDLLRRKEDATASTVQSDQKELAAIEKQILAQQARQAAAVPGVVPAPSTFAAPAGTPPGLAATTSGSTPAVTAALEAAAAAPPPMTPRQRQIQSAPRLAEVRHYEKDYGFVEITAGSGRNIQMGMGFAIRRGSSIIGRVKVTEVDVASAIASVDSRSVPPGVLIEVGDEVIQDLPPGT